MLRFQGGSRAWGKATLHHRGTRDAAARQQGEKALQVDPHALDQVSGSQVDPHALDQVPGSVADPDALDKETALPRPSALGPVKSVGIRYETRRGRRASPCLPRPSAALLSLRP